MPLASLASPDLVEEKATAIPFRESEFLVSPESDWSVSGKFNLGVGEILQ